MTIHEISQTIFVHTLLSACRTILSNIHHRIIFGCIDSDEDVLSDRPRTLLRIASWLRRLARCCAFVALNPKKRPANTQTRDIIVTKLTYEKVAISNWATKCIRINHTSNPYPHVRATNRNTTEWICSENVGNGIWPWHATNSPGNPFCLQRLIWILPLISIHKPGKV